MLEKHQSLEHIRYLQKKICNQSQLWGLHQEQGSNDSCL